ncbi:hypothetical protein [Sulfitobacter aestuariivivens]|uniref:hypothetical protein n=1 Tax=Sulfitobacter aestuariivivens TaxID=2766981 RepID=UPI001FE6E45D|nr:hypothetical protein [Sulfitobacter aestuariivivens]
MMRHLTTLLLALMLAITSQSMAVARGASAASGQMVICTGTGPVAVFVDAQGQPTQAPHLCPDATLQVLTDLDMSGPHWIGVDLGADLSGVHPERLYLSQGWRGPPSRGPPLDV